MTQPEHLDLDELADLSVGQAGADSTAHVRTCLQCTARLRELEVAAARVDGSLQQLPDPPLPADLPQRLTAALARERRAGSASGSATVVPLPRRSRRVLPWAGGVAAAAVLVTGGILLSHLSVGTSSKAGTGADRSSAVAGPAVAQVPTSSTGSDYGRDGVALRAALPRLLHDAQATSPYALNAPTATAPLPATKQSTPVRSLAALRTPPGLAACLSALQDPADRTAPLALDFARFAGSPALVVVLPGTTPSVLDVYVVGSTCSAADAQVRLFVHATAPG